ncbi:YgaP family membrane protein [Cypionkella sinensis]|jgi:hypothetical protein|uniref:DUF2892 domain-containing protein n=1 Tax=Cypionkella sinensis TaxID=1756043 RepID=A0ABV7IX01_9RHOB
MLQTNIGTLDRSFRLVIGLGLLLWFFLDQGTGFWHYAKLIGLVAIATAALRTCPLYTVLGLRT